MTNLERYKDEFAYMLNDVAYQPPVCNYFEKIWAYSDCSCCPFCTKDNTGCDYQKFVSWLLEEHKEPIKLTKFEYDLLMSYINKGYYFKNFSELKEMRNKGYFKGITDTSMKIQYILNNCEVEDD